MSIEHKILDKHIIQIIDSYGSAPVSEISECLKRSSAVAADFEDLRRGEIWGSRPAPVFNLIRSSDIGPLIRRRLKTMEKTGALVLIREGWSMSGRRVLNWRLGPSAMDYYRVVSSAHFIPRNASRS